MLAAYCASAWADASDVANFSIEGFKVGMSGEEAKALLQEKCSGKIEEKESNGVTKLSCSLKDKGDYFYKDITLQQKDKVGKIKLSLAMNYKSDASDGTSKNCAKAKPRN